MLYRTIHLAVSPEKINNRLSEIAIPGSYGLRTPGNFCVSVRIRKLGGKGFSAPRKYSGLLLPNENGTFVRFSVNPHPGGLIFAAAGISLAIMKAFEMLHGKGVSHMFWISLLVAVGAVSFVLADEAEHLDHFEALIKNTM